MKRIHIATLILTLMFAPGVVAWAQSGGEEPEENAPAETPSAEPEQPAPAEDEGKGEVEKLKDELKNAEKQIQKLERQDALDRIQFGGDYRFEAHTIDATIPDHYDGMLLQNALVNTLFYYGATGQFPQNPTQVNQFIAGHYGDYMYFTDHLTFDALKGYMSQFPPEMQQQLMGMLLPYTYVPGYDANNTILYTNRLRLTLEAPVGENISFSGRLSMYKVFGDSTGVQVFNGQPNSIAIDGTTVGVPNSDILRVERAYFDWKNIGGLPIYLSIGRRPSTGGAPLHLRQDEPRGGSPLGSVIDYQFDGITFGVHIGEHSTARLCYGLGYESGFGNGDVLKLPQDRLDDAQFIGINWDIWNSDATFVQTTLAWAIDVTDGFNGLVVLPNNPVTGQPIGAPVILRFTPSANLGNITLASGVVTRRDGPLDWFVSGNYMSSDPTLATTPFGGLFSDPFEKPESHSGGMIYVGARYNFANEKTKLGLEYNHGSKYWFNFSAAEDDIIAPKTNTRGDVVELYLTHRIAKRFIFKADFMHYKYDYSGSGWHLGAPKPLDEKPILGFPTYDRISKLAVSMVARF
ncbi:MAG: DUF3373 family protein [Acidobacteriota bacterium]